MIEQLDLVGTAAILTVIELAFGYFICDLLGISVRWIPDEEEDE